jgi:hypothetical protein
MIAGVSPLFDRLTAYVLCPDAVDSAYRDYGAGTPTTSSPSGRTGHLTELTCTYADSSQRVLGNDEVGLKGLAASFTAAGICGMLAVLFQMLAAAVIGARVVKPGPTQR